MMWLSGPSASALLASTIVVFSTQNARGANVTLIEVMKAGESSTDCSEPPCKYAAFRIPGLVVMQHNGSEVMMAFAEGRKTGCGDFDGQHDLMMKRSLDGGKTWGPLVTVVDAISFWPHINATKKPEKGNAVWDPTPLADASTGRVFCFFNGPGREETELCQTWVAVSDDAGVTWSIRNVTSECQRAGPKPGSRAGNTPGNGHGVQLSTGRLVVPMYSGVPAGASICYSDDHGDTWHASPTPFGGVASTEIEVAELNPSSTSKRSVDSDKKKLANGGDASTPTLYMTIRNDAAVASEGHRQFSLSNDLGLTWSPRENVQVPDPNCKGGVVQWKEGGGLVLSTSASCSGRENQTVFLSMDNGAPGSWIHHQFIYGPSGYSTLQMSSGGTMIADLFESGGCSLTLALVDPREMLKDSKNNGYLSCASTHCGGANPDPPATPPDPNRGFCMPPAPPPTPPPPPPAPLSPECQAKVDAFCSNATANPSCVVPSLRWYPDAQPFKARWDTGCSVEPKKPWPHGVPDGPCQVGGTIAKSWRCYSHLALGSDGAWSNSAPHPNAYCSEDGPMIEAIIKTCAHHP